MPTITRPRTLQDIDLTLIAHTPFNPAGRREKVANLKESIGEFGQLEAIHVVRDGSRFIIADGNRRVETLRQLGVNRARAYVYEGGQEVLKQLFVELNQPKMTLKNGQMLQAALQGGPSFNGTVSSAEKYLNEHFSEQERELLVRQGVTPYGLSVAKRIAAYTMPGTSKETATFHSRVRKTLFWLMRHQTQQAAIAYMRQSYSSEALKKAVDRDSDTVPHMGK